MATAAMAQLRDQVRGEILTPEDAAYDDARRVYNAMIDRRPRVVVRCAGVDDVVAAVNFARESGLAIAVRGGSHSVPGFGTADDAVVIDLVRMQAVEVDPTRRTARAQGGATWGAFNDATHEHGLATTGGIISTTGVGGLTLGGGIGYLSRGHGLSCDNLRAAEVVTADGRILAATESENEDLFWALRGGGGNFGVVTSFEFGLTPVGPLVHLGMFMYAPEQGGDVFRFAREYVKELPDECGVFMAGLSAPPEPFVPEEHHLAPVYALLIVGFGDAESHAALVEPVRAALTPLVEFVTPMSYTALQQMFNDSAPWGILAYEKSVYLDELSDAAVDVILEQQPKKAFPLSFLPIFVLGGAYSRAADDDSAFGGKRSHTYMVNIAAAAPTPELYAVERDWVRTFWSALAPHAVDVGSYVNFMTEPEEDRVRAAYGPQKYERLAQIKAHYDPDNVFHLNANIRPAASTHAV